MSGQGAGEGTPKGEGGRGAAARIARAIVWFRFVIIPGWIALAILATLKLPSIFDAGAGSIGDALPESSQAAAVETQANRTFGVPLLSRTVVVGSDPSGLSRSQIAAAMRFIARFDRHPPRGSAVRGALPLVDLPKLATASTAGRTLVALTFVRPSLSQSEQTAVTHEFAARLQAASGIAEVNVTGPIPARFENGQIAADRMQWVELATLALVVGILALYFRAFGIPLLGIATVAIAYACASHLLGWLGERRGVAVPQEVEPVIVALLFGVLTDYVVFFASGYRRPPEE